VEKNSSNGAVVEAIGVDVLSRWNQRVRVTGIDWKVLPGEFWVVGGPHGSGKSDLLMTVAGLHRPASGRLLIFGTDVTKASESEILQERLRIGFVFKGGGRMFNDQTVAENVALPVRYHYDWDSEQAREHVNAALEMTELTGMASEAAQSLGGDWQQRVGLARALALKPDALFLDEPAAGLEPRHRDWLRGFLAELTSGAIRVGGKKVTVVTATNDPGLWRQKGHRHAVIQDGHWQVLGDEETRPQTAKV
jgi:ABC-type transporter Mla maintaining outer membrane lipid asymmetry ATPase subunit MlaF